MRGEESESRLQVSGSGADRFENGGSGPIGGPARTAGPRGPDRPARPVWPRGTRYGACAHPGPPIRKGANGGWVRWAVDIRLAGRRKAGRRARAGARCDGPSRRAVAEGGPNGGRRARLSQHVRPLSPAARSLRSQARRAAATKPPPARRKRRRPLPAGAGAGRNALRPGPTTDSDTKSSVEKRRAQRATRPLGSDHASQTT